MSQLSAAATLLYDDASVKSGTIGDIQKAEQTDTEMLPHSLIKQTHEFFITAPQARLRRHCR